MNLVYIHTHDLGDWISAYGREMDTPNLEDLAQESMVFTNAHAAAPTCSPSRAALLTGVNPHQASMLGLAHRGFSLTHPERHLASRLRAHGYETVLCGIQHEFSSSGVEGFPYDVVVGQVHRREGERSDAFQRRRDREVADAATEWIHNRKGGGGFFLSVGFFQPHRPLIEPDPERVPEDVEVPGSLPEGDAVRRDARALKTSVRMLDEAVGKVMRALKETGRWDDSIILFTTDHGIAFPLYKCCLKDSGTRVAMMLRHPDLPATHGCREDALVSQLDVVPTLLDWLGLPAPAWCEGHSLDPLIRGEVSRVREEVFSEVNFHAAYEPMRSIRTEKHRLVRRFLNDGGWVLSNIDDSPSKEAWLETPGFRNGLAGLELYSLEEDPMETVNLAEEPAYREARERLLERLHGWMERTQDPLLHGHLLRPAMGMINHRDSISNHQPYYEEIVQ